MGFTYNLWFYALLQHVKKPPFHTYSSNKVSSIQYQISFFLKKVLNILDSDCQNAILYTKLLIQYTVLTLFFSHKIHFIRFYLYIIYYWSMELRIIAEGLPSCVTSCTCSSRTELYKGCQRCRSSLVPPRDANTAIHRLNVPRWQC